MASSSNKQAHAPTFIRYGGGVDQFGNATKSQGLVIDPGLLPRDALAKKDAIEQPTSDPEQNPEEAFRKGAFLLVRKTGVSPDSQDLREAKHPDHGLEDSLLVPLRAQMTSLPSRSQNSESPKISLPRLTGRASSSPRPTPESVDRIGRAVECPPRAWFGMNDPRQSSSPRLVRSTPEDPTVRSCYERMPSRGPTLSPGRDTTCSPTLTLHPEASVVGTASRSSVTLCASPDSTDSDVLSLQYLEPVQNLDPEQSLVLALTKVVERLLSRCNLEPGTPQPVLSLQGGYGAMGRGISGIPGSSPDGASSLGLSGATRQTKRSWSDYGGERTIDGTIDGSNLRSPKLRKALQKKPRYFSCPFSKLHPMKHAGCCKLNLVRIRDVRQHLTWRHSPQFYCERCYAVFEAEATHEDHIVNASCVRLPSAELDGISHATDRALRRKLDRSLTEEEQWLAIWRILFPRSEKPASVFVDPELSARLDLFRKHWREYGSQLLAEFAGVTDSEQAEQERLLWILDTGTGALIDQWLLTLTVTPESTQSRTPKGDNTKLDSAALR